MNEARFLEGMEEVDFERLAKSAIPTNSRSGKDDHWPEASDTVFAALLYDVFGGNRLTGNMDGPLRRLLQPTRERKQTFTKVSGQQKVVKRGLSESFDGTLAQEASLLIGIIPPEYGIPITAQMPQKYAPFMAYKKDKISIIVPFVIAIKTRLKRLCLYWRMRRKNRCV